MKNILKYLPLSIAMGIVVYYYFIVLTTPEGYIWESSYNNFFYSSDTIKTSKVTFPYILSTLSLFICLVLIRLKKSYWDTLFAIIIALSLTPLIKFGPGNYYIGLGILKVEIVSLILFLIHLEANPQVLKSFKSLFNLNNQNGSTYIDENMVRVYEHKLLKLTNSELQKIISEDLHVASAKEAAKRLLDRKTKNP